jgi:hypothetical protein
MLRISLADFYRFNPSVGAGCSKFVLGTYYCYSTNEDGSTPEGPGTTTAEMQTPTSEAIVTLIPPRMAWYLAELLFTMSSRVTDAGRLVNKQALVLICLILDVFFKSNKIKLSIVESQIKIKSKCSLV